VDPWAIEATGEPLTPLVTLALRTNAGPPDDPAILSGVVDEGADAFFEFATEFADGERWKVLRAKGWVDFEERLAETIGDLPVRRRQALVMLLFALIESIVEPPEVRTWMDAHDVSTDEGIEALIAWLRRRRGDDPH
jgi:hypothetical protein